MFILLLVPIHSVDDACTSRLVYERTFIRYQATAMKLEQEKTDKEVELKSAQERFIAGQPPTDDAEHEWLKLQRDRQRQQEMLMQKAAAKGDPRLVFFLVVAFSKSVVSYDAGVSDSNDTMRTMVLQTILVLNMFSSLRAHVFG
jgi:hypothetical protein